MGSKYGKNAADNTTVSMAGVSQRVVADVRREILSAPYPASTGVVCGGLLRDEFLLEVVPTAVIPPAADDE